MRVSILGPTNIKKYNSIMEMKQEDVEAKARSIGRILAKYKCEVVMVFNYEGMLKMIGDAYKSYGGKLVMLYTENDSDWETKPYEENIKEVSDTEKKDSWHDMILSLVSDSEIVICAGLSAGVFVELGYMKWNIQDKRGKCKDLIGIKDLLRGEDLPVELGKELDKITTLVSVAELEKALDKLLDKKEEA